MITDEQHWERWMRSSTKREQAANADSLRPACPPDLVMRLAKEFSKGPLESLARAGSSHGVDSLWDLKPEALSDVDVRVLGHELARVPEYTTRVKILFLVGRVTSPSDAAFEVLRDHFWRVDVDEDPPENSERYMCWSFAEKHATAARIDDLLQAVRAREHGSSRALAISALGRFPGHADALRPDIRQSLQDVTVAPDAAEVLAKIGDVGAIPLLEHCLENLAGKSTYPDAFAKRITKSLKALRTHPPQASPK